MKTTILTIVSILLLSTQSFAQNYDLLVGSKSKVTCEPNVEAPKFVAEMATAWASEDDTLEEGLIKINVKLNDQWIDLLKDKTVRAETETADFEELLKAAVCVATVFIKQKNYSDNKIKDIQTIVEMKIKANRSEFEKIKSPTKEEVHANKLNELMWDNRGAVSMFVEAFNG